MNPRPKLKTLPSSEPQYAEDPEGTEHYLVVDGKCVLYLYEGDAKTLRQAKFTICELLNIPYEKLILQWEGRVLEENKSTLKELGVRDGDKLFIIRNESEEGDDNEDEEDEFEEEIPAEEEKTKNDNEEKNETDIQ